MVQLPLRVIHVDDSQAYLMVFRQSFESATIDIRSFASAKSARSSVENGECDVLVVDHEGFQLAKEMQNRFGIDSIVVISSQSCVPPFQASLRVEKLDSTCHSKVSDLLQSAVKRKVDKGLAEHPTSEQRVISRRVNYEQYPGEVLVVGLDSNTVLFHSPSLEKAESWIRDQVKGRARCRILQSPPRERVSFAELIGE
jgi:DNA-binding NtrC family response regulator